MPVHDVHWMPLQLLPILLLHSLKGKRQKMSQESDVNRFSSPTKLPVFKFELEKLDFGGYICVYTHVY